MKVLHVIDGCNLGGIEALALNLIVSLSSRCQSSLLICDNSRLSMLKRFTNVKRDGQLSDIFCFHRVGLLKLFLNSLRVFRSSMPDCVIIYPCKKPFLAVALAARVAGISLVFVHVGTRAPDLSYAKKKWQLLVRLFRLTGAQLVPCSKSIVDSLQSSFFPIKFAPIINNGCDVEFIRERVRLLKMEMPTPKLK